MTTPPVLPNEWEPLTTISELATWTQQSEIDAEQIPFATLILGGVAVLVRNAGSLYWTHDTIPPRAKLLADIKAKDYYEHPLGAKNETVGPLNQGFVDRVLAGMELTLAERELLAGLAGTVPDDGKPTLTGIWALSTTRGPLETHRHMRGVVTVQWATDRPGSKGFPLFAYGEFGSPYDEDLCEGDVVYPAELLP